MAITRTAKGTAEAKTSGTTLTVADVEAGAGTTLIVGIAYDNSGGAPMLKWKGKPFALVPGSEQENAGTGMTVAIYKKPVRKSATRDVEASWTSAIEARAMFVTLIDEASADDVGQTNEQDATTGPNTGTAVTSTEANTISIAAFASKGPRSDNAGTAGEGHTLGQRDGTITAQPTTNITIQETFEILAATGDIRSSLTVNTARDFATTIAAFSAAEVYTVDSTEHYPVDADTDQESVRFNIRNAASDIVFQVRLPVEAFNQMNDAQVTECIRYACGVFAEKLAGPTGVNPVDADIETRAATFVNDTITV